jgi:COP9 signalosome complex subunit 2
MRYDVQSASVSALTECSDKRLSAKTNLKLAKLWLDRGEYTRLSKVCPYASCLSWFIFPHHSQLIRELYTVTEASASSDDQSQKGTQLLEIYALEIQMHNETKNYKKLKASLLSTPTQNGRRHDLSLQEIYNASTSIRSAIPHPRIMGIIKECGGKMWMGERW